MLSLVKPNQPSSTSGPFYHYKNQQECRNYSTRMMPTILTAIKCENMRRVLKRNRYRTKLKYNSLGPYILDILCESGTFFCGGSQRLCVVFNVQAQSLDGLAGVKAARRDLASPQFSLVMVTLPLICMVSMAVIGVTR